MPHFWLLFLGISIACIVITLYKKAGSLNYRPLFSLFLAGAAAFLTVSTIFFPQAAFEASLNGLSIWWNIVFPALLPFFIFSQILIGLGVVHMMGVFLEPLMRPVFNVPGAGSFVLAMGLASGFPLGAVLTSEMRGRNLVSKVEAERLVSFVNTADPLFLFGAVAVGMFGYPEVGTTIAAAHYLSTISVGLVMRFYGRNQESTPETNSGKDNIIYRAVKALLKARQEDGRMLGQLMGDAVQKSINTQMIIGGFIILFSVIISMLEALGVVGLLSGAVVHILRPFGLAPELAGPLISGLFEVDLGCQAAADPQNGVDMDQRLIAVGMIIAWSGLAVHAQVASIVSDTDIDIKPYIAARLLHAFLAGLYTFLLLEFQAIKDLNIPAFLSTVPSATLDYWWTRTYYILQRISLLMILAFCLSLTIHFFTRLKKQFFIKRC